MIATTIYLNFNGNCEEAFDFYKSVFGNEFSYKSRFADIPPTEGYSAPEEFKNRILHVSLPIGSTELMGSDCRWEQAEFYKEGNNFSISVSAGSREEADRIFKALSEGGTVTMPQADTFWGDYFGMFTDKFGINWMVSAS